MDEVALRARDSGNQHLKKVPVDRLKKFVNIRVNQSGHETGQNGKSVVFFYTHRIKTGAVKPPVSFYVIGRGDPGL